jgi:AraC-like DNA-binding protein
VQDEQMFLLFSADMPSIVSIDRASQSNPYTAILFRLDLDLARAVAGSVDTHLIDIPPQAEAGMAQGRVDDDLLEVILRLVRLIERQQEIPVLAGLVQRELLFRLLVSSSGNRLRHIIMQDSPSHRISRAIRWLRENYAKRTTVDELAEQVGMGVSTLHRHFQEVTTMSPLQYQKSLRLHEARRLMITDHVEAGAAAYRVGYESATQFNREYRRLFGAPPIRDTKALRQVKQSAVI